MMSYVVETSDNHVAVIDGGNTADSDYLAAFLGGRPVDLWFITHPHPDHIDALSDILRRNLVKVIGMIGWDPPSDEILGKDPSGAKDSYEGFLAAVAGSGQKLTRVVTGERYLLGGTSLVVLSGANPDLPHVNDSSLVLKLESTLPVLFLGDLEQEGGERLLKSHPNQLWAFAVQMAHHGQSGVSEAFYRAVDPTVAFWPTPVWLWDNNPPVGGSGPGTGPWTTWATRDWLTKLGVGINLVMKDGPSTLLIDGQGGYRFEGVNSPLGRQP